MSLPTSSIRQSSVSLPRGDSPRAEWKSTNRSRKVPSGRRAESAVFRIEPASSGDHAAIYHFLTSLSRGPTESEFQLILDRPHYNPADRLLLRHGKDLAGHIRLTRRQLRLGGVWLPTCELSEFALFPEYSREDLSALLMNAARRQAIAEGAVALTTLSDRPDAILDRHWVPCGASSFCESSPRDILANCADELARFPHAERLYVRPWRYVEQGALDHLYQSNVRSITGAPLREEDYWHWLLVRRGFDNILVVTTSAVADDVAESELSADQIVAYAFVRAGDIVEMMVNPDCPEAALRLVKRVAADAIERDEHQVRVFGTPRACEVSSILNRVFPPSRESRQKAGRPTQSMWVLDCATFVKTSWRCHAKKARPREMRLGLQLEDAALTVVVQDGELSVDRGAIARPHVRARGAAVTALLTGQVMWKQIDAMPELVPSSTTAAKLAERLFQPLTFWRSTLDDLPSFQ